MKLNNFSFYSINFNIVTFVDKYTSIFETPWQKLKSPNESRDFGVGGIENS